MILCAALAAAAHFIIFPLLSMLKEGDGDVYVFSPGNVDTTLAPLPSIDEKGENGGNEENGNAKNRTAVPGRMPQRRYPAGLSTSLIPVPPEEADLLSPEDTSRSPLPNVSAGVNVSQYAPGQDSAFFRAKRLHITSRVRFHNDIARTDSAWNAEKKRRDNTPEALMEKNLAVAPEELQPTQRDMMNHARQYTPGAPQNYSPNIPRAGVSIPFSMGALLGYEEDVSATVEYTLPVRAFVRITVYAADGNTVATPLAAEQPAGKHSFTWDATDEEGRRVRPGDYVAEIVIGNAQRILKHIVVS